MLLKLICLGGGQRTTYDFDDFLKLPTCASGPHVPKQRKVKKKDQ